MLAEILSTFPAGFDGRLEALAAWRQVQDRLAVQEQATKPAVPKSPATARPNVESLSHVGGAPDEQRRGGKIEKLPPSVTARPKRRLL
jgi:hypothetical protein